MDVWKDSELTSDLCLNQVVPLRANVFEEARDVNGVFVSYLFQHAVEDDVRARPAHASTARQHERKNELSSGFDDVRMKMKTKL